MTITTISPPNIRLRHTHIAQAINECQLMLTAGNNANLILVCGPTGVGKSTLGTFLIEAELKKQAKILALNPGHVPAIGVEAPASGERDFSWRLLYLRILSALEGDLDIPRTPYGLDSISGGVSRPTGHQIHRLSGLRTAVERSLRHRHTRFIVLDEAAHMMRQCHPHRLEQQLDTLKSLSNECGVQWVLLGSYDLFELLSLSGQLARRTHVIHFGRYREDSDADVYDFHLSLNQLANTMPSLKDIDLMRYAEVFHQNSLGCIGTLRTILFRLNLLVNDSGWSENTLRTALLADEQVTQILREINEGEERIAPGLKRRLIAQPLEKKKPIA